MDEPSGLSDEALIEAARSASGGAAFAALYERHKGFVMRVALRFCGDAELAADAVQETFMVLSRKLASYEPRARLTTFLYPIARNRALSLARSSRRGHGRTVTIEGVEHASAGPGAGAATEESMADGPLRLAVMGLSEILREVLLLRVVEGLDTAETAAALDIPQGTVKTRLKAALDQLRQDPRTRGLWDG